MKTYMEPVLKTKVFAENGEVYRIRVKGGLHIITKNHAPYFSLTCDIDRKAGNGHWVEYSGGADHETIVKHFPEMAVLAKLHLSDIDGIPTYAVENGWYWFKGGCDVFGEWKQADTPKGKSCLDVFADYMRVSIDTASNLVLNNFSKEEFTQWVELQKPRWKREAVECIAKHNLTIYGDK